MRQSFPTQRLSRCTTAPAAVALAVLAALACGTDAPTDPGGTSRERLRAVYAESEVQSPDSTPGMCFITYPAWATEFPANPYAFTCGVIQVRYRSISDTATLRLDATRLDATILSGHATLDGAFGAFLQVTAGTECDAIVTLLESDRTAWAHPNYIVIVGP